MAVLNTPFQKIDLWYSTDGFWAQLPWMDFGRRDAQTSRSLEVKMAIPLDGWMARFLDGCTARRLDG